VHPDLVVLVDQLGHPTSTALKSEVHSADTPLHLAFSAYLFDVAGNLLLTRRALRKITWPGVWSNSCCGHVRPGESPEHAALRRCREELGVEVADLRVALPDFRYRATSPEGVVENEICPVFVGRVTGDPLPDPEEIVEFAWTPWRHFRMVAADGPWAISPWAALQAAALPADLPAFPAVRGPEDS
jgi:isopentenyl-diphosphate delta-isomerase type 1